MSDVSTTRSAQGQWKGAWGESKAQEPSRIRLDVPMATSYNEIQECIFRQAWQMAGTQLRAAIALGITPDTISCFLRRCDRAKVASPKVPEAWPVVAPPEPPSEIKRAIGPSGHRAIDSENQTSDQAISGDGAP